MAYQESPGADKLRRVTAVLKAAETTLPLGSLCKLSDNGDPNEVVKLAADTDTPYGVADVALVAGAVGTVVTDGECLALTGGAYSRAAELASDGDHSVIAAVSGDLIIGYALEDSTASAQLRQIIFKPAGRLKA